MRTMTFAAAVLFAVSLPLGAQSLDARLQKAIQTETVAGDLQAAIDEYRSIAAAAGSNRRIAAQALVRMAECYRRLGDAEAAKIYERIVRDFGDQAEAAAEARMRLAGMRASAVKPPSQTAREIWTGAGVDGMGAPSLDGRILSYTDWTTGDLALRDLTTGHMRRLTDTGGWEKSGDFAELSLPSPDGAAVAYAWFNDRDAREKKYSMYDLRLTGTAPGSRPRVIYQSADLGWVSPVAWSPDGQHLVIVRHRQKEGADVALLTIRTGAIRSIRSHGQTTVVRRASVSPDGRFVAYDAPASGVRDPRDVFLSALDGSSHAVVASHPGEDTAPFFSPDGATLIFMSNRGGSNGLWGVPLREGQAAGPPKLLKQDVGAISPLGMTAAGQLYYFAAGDRVNSLMATIDAGFAPKTEPALVADRFQNHNMSATWSPDGRSLAYYRFHGLREDQGAALVVRDIASGQEREYPLKAQAFRASSAVRWFPDGRAILVAGRNPEKAGLVFSRVDLETGAERALLTNIQLGPATSTAVLSADATSIFYITKRDDEAAIMRTVLRYDLATGTNTVLLEGATYAIALSRDGQRLAYLGSRKDTSDRESEIGFIPVAGGERTVLFSGVWMDPTRFHALSWTPDDRHILFVRADGPVGSIDTALWRVPAAGGEARRTGLTARGQIKFPDVHPDGTRLLYSVAERSDSSVWVLENFLPVAATRR